jgi:hypothetical protein
MNPDTGKLVEVESAQDALAKGLVPVRRDLRAKEACDLQIKLYSPCGCGSGKYKFCCKDKPKFVFNTDPS